MNKRKLNRMELEEMLLVLGVLALLTVLLVRLILYLMDFRQELKYINMEIHRTEGGEQRYWRSQKRKLWRSLLPFGRKD